MAVLRFKCLLRSKRIQLTSSTNCCFRCHRRNVCSLCCTAQCVLCLFHSVDLCPGWVYPVTVVRSQPSLIHLGQDSSQSLPKHPPLSTNMADKREPPFFNDDNLGVVNYKLPFYETMELFIETLTGTCFQLRVSPFETIVSVKAKIQRLEGMCTFIAHV